MASSSLSSSPPRFSAISSSFLSISDSSLVLRRKTLRAMGSGASSSSSSQIQEKVDVSSVSEEEWKKRLTQQQYYVTRQKGTEIAFTGEYWNTKTPGAYHCICCDTPLKRI